MKGEGTMTNRLAGKVAVVTGGASGFGRATSILFAAEGARVVVADLDESGGAGTVQQIVDKGGEAAFVPGDVSERSVADTIVAESLSRFGQLQVLVNNAGIAQTTEQGRSWDAPEEQWDRVIKANLRSVYVCSRAAIPAMLEAGSGSIVNVASIAASVSVGGSAYAASKGGILSYTRHVAVELAPTVRANCVSPGFMRTPMSTGERHGATPSEQEQRMAVFGSYSPMGKAGSADDIANAILYLAGDESAFVTGAELLVDGGHLVRSY
jgi:NAD(P)-dependent dehydrogenase (short-subunit alcohol dehydrogenase family)